MSIEVRSNEPVLAHETKVEKSIQAKGAESSQETKPAHGEESEQKLTENSGITETEDKEVTEPENEDHSDESEQDKSEDSEGDKPKKKGGFQKRIDKLNARVSAKEQELEHWKQLALKTQQPIQQLQVPKVETALNTDDGKPDPNKFDKHQDYIEALTDWKTDQKFKEREAKQEQSKLLAEQANIVKAHQERLKSFVEKTKDFDDVMAEVEDVPVSPMIQQLLISSENGPELMYELAKNRSDLEKLNKLSLVMAAREIGRIESRIASNSSPETKIETKKITSAPKPLEPVGAGGKGAVKKSLSDPNLSQAEYEAMRREQLRRRA